MEGAASSAPQEPPSSKPGYTLKIAFYKASSAGSRCHFSKQAGKDACATRTFPELDSHPSPLNSQLPLNLLDRHIFKSVLGTCLAAMGLFTFVLMLGNAVKDLLGYVLAGQITVPMCVKLILLLIPYVVIYALPMGMLTGILLTLGRLSADSEVTAMRAAGISLWRISRPIMLLGVLGVVLGLYVNFESMPWSRVEYHKQLSIAVRADPISFIVPKTFIRDFKGFVVYVGDRQGNVLHDVWVWKLDPERRVTSLSRATTGRVAYDEEANALRVTLTPAVVEARNDKDPEIFEKAPFVNMFGVLPSENFSLERFFNRENAKTKTEWLTYAELRDRQLTLEKKVLPPTADPKEHERQVKEHARDKMKTAIVLHEKANLALAVLTFVLIGIPLGIKVSRRETSANLGVALALVLSYYLLTVMVKWLDQHPEYRPDLLLWVPNLIFLAVAVSLFRRVERA